MERYNWFYARAEHALVTSVGLEAPVPVKIERHHRAAYLPEGYGSGVLPYIFDHPSPALAQVLALEL
jgi:hypothetical protein